MKQLDFIDKISAQGAANEPEHAMKFSNHVADLMREKYASIDGGQKDFADGFPNNAATGSKKGFADGGMKNAIEGEPNIAEGAIKKPIDGGFKDSDLALNKLAKLNKPEILEDIVATKFGDSSKNTFVSLTKIVKEKNESKDAAHTYLTKLQLSQYEA